jgi:gliding motility-associated-like protein
MKTAYIFIAFFFCSYSVSFAQNKNDATQQNALREIQIKAGSPFSYLQSRTGVNRTPIRDSLSVSQLLNPDSLINYVYRKSGKTLPPKKLNRQLSVKSKTGNLCADSSFVRQLSTYASWINISTVVPTDDGGFLIPALMYDTTRKPEFTWRTFGLLIKIDGEGKVLWIKQFDNTDPVTFSTFFMYNAFELTNKDIICVGSIDTTSGLGAYNNIVCRLDKNGNIIWQTGLHTSVVNSYPTISINIRSVAEGPNGDIILCGTTDSYSSSGQHETIIRIDSGGNVIWDANYGNDGPYLFGAEGLAAYVINGQIVTVGITHGTNNPQTAPAINILTLDYNTGNLVSKRFFRPSYPDQMEEFRKSFTYFSNNCTQLSNGNFVVYGQLFSDFMSQPAMIDHFGIVEFDRNFNLVKSYTISSALQTNYYGNILYINKEGKGLLSLFKYDASYNITRYFGAFEQQQFLKQRKVFYGNLVIPENSGFAYTKDNGYVFVQSDYEGGKKNSVEFRKMHNSDTSSLCLGTDTFFMRFLPLHIIEDPGYYYLDTNISKKVQQVHYNISQNDTLKVLSANPCKQLNYCDTVKIHGNPIICGSQPSIRFTAYKNPECGGIVQWNIDPAGIDSLKIQNDSSVLVHFKNNNWQGKLYASLPAGKCYLPAVDSINVSIARSQIVLNLGPDTLLCKGNSMVLHAGAGFINYQWQDGSKDSVFTVTQPGLYHVLVSDACGGTFNDTVIVSPHPPIPFDLGPNISICKNDTTNIVAPLGFEHYQWTRYNIIDDTLSTARVFPLMGTWYKVVAQEAHGCFASDSVYVTVNTVPAIHLGNDTSFCANQSVILDAGHGYDTYTWNTGVSAEKITVKQKGDYSVVATLNGCIASDTLNILNVYPLPSFSLGNDTTLCENQQLHYDFNLQQATYLWSTGNISNSETIHLPGNYWLQVVQNGCAASDTLKVVYQPAPVVTLGNDTTLCEGQTLLLNAYNDEASYLWQDGSTAPSQLVKKPGIYFITANIDNCVASDSIAVDYKALPHFSLGRDTLLCESESYVLSPVITTNALLQWQDGSTGRSFTASKEGVYFLVATNECGSYADSMMITTSFCNIIMPTAFTPNADGLNDIFKVKYPFPVKEFHLMVYNRWGNKVFETNKINEGWDGNYKGEPSIQGSYVWVISFVDINNKPAQLKGIVTLLR